MGLIIASLPATRTWERADQALLDLFASEIGVAIRNAELFEQVQDQNAQLRRLSDVKDDFLRGVSHNLQTPLTSIKSNAEALGATDPDPRLTVIWSRPIACRGWSSSSCSLAGSSHSRCDRP